MIMYTKKWNYELHKRIKNTNSREIYTHEITIFEATEKDGVNGYTTRWTWFPKVGLTKMIKIT